MPPTTRLLTVVLLLLSCPLKATPQAQEPGYPRLVNIFWQGSFDPAPTIEALAQWQVVVLNPIWTQEQLAQLRALNPDIKIFFMVNTYSMPKPGTTLDTWRIENVNYALENDLWWYDTNSQIASDWPDTWMVNLTSWSASPSQGHWLEFFAAQVVKLIDSRPDLDGIYFDNFWRRISWQQANRQLDSDCNPTHRPQGCDGVADTPEQLDAMWNTALRTFAADVRARFDVLQTQRQQPLAILTNGASDYFESLNGTMLEYFPSGHSSKDFGSPYGYNWWSEMLQYPAGYLVAPFREMPYSFNILNAEAPGTLNTPVLSLGFQRHKRFCLASALMGDGYLSLDAGLAGHGNLWWEPEYDHAGRGREYLGAALGPMRRVLQANGTELLADSGFDEQPTAWLAFPFDTDGVFSLDATTLHSAPFAARIDIGALLGPVSYKVWQANLALVRDESYTLRFWARASGNSELSLFISSPECPGERCLFEHNYALTPQWQLYESSFTANATTDIASLNLFLDKVGTVWLDDVSLRQGDSRVFRRDFENGIALLNVTPKQQIIDLETTFYRLDIPTSDVFDGAALTQETMAAADGRILLRSPAGPPPPPNGDPTDVTDTAQSRLHLYPNQPNPFANGTRISFEIPQEGVAEVTVHDVRGRFLRRLHLGPVAAGITRQVFWDGRDHRGAELSPGTYLLRLRVGQEVRTRKVQLTR
jgi:hypothetical protein